MQPKRSPVVVAATRWLQYAYTSRGVLVASAFALLVMGVALRSLGGDGVDASEWLRGPNPNDMPPQVYHTGGCDAEMSILRSARGVALKPQLRRAYFWTCRSGSSEREDGSPARETDACTTMAVVKISPVSEHSQDEIRVAVALAQLDRPSAAAVSVCPHFAEVRGAWSGCSRIPEPWIKGALLQEAGPPDGPGHGCSWMRGETCPDMPYTEPGPLMALETSLVPEELMVIIRNGRAQEPAKTAAITSAVIFQLLFSTAVGERAVALSNQDIRASNLRVERRPVGDGSPTVWEYHLPGHPPYYIDAAQTGGASLRLIDLHLSLHVWSLGYSGERPSHDLPGPAERTRARQGNAIALCQRALGELLEAIPEDQPEFDATVRMLRELHGYLCEATKRVVGPPSTASVESALLDLPSLREFTRRPPHAFSTLVFGFTHDLHLQHLVRGTVVANEAIYRSLGHVRARLDRQTDDTVLPQIP